MGGWLSIFVGDLGDGCPGAINGCLLVLDNGKWWRAAAPAVGAGVQVGRSKDEDCAYGELQGG